MTGKPARIGLAFLPACIIFMLLSACGGTSPPVKYYSLQPIPASAGKVRLPPDVAIAVGPVQIPAAFDRPQIVTRDASDNIEISDFNRWAGSLQENIASVLSENLASRLGSNKVTPFTREAIFNPTHRIIVNINSLDGWFQGAFVLDAVWSFKSKKQPEPLLVKKAVIREPLPSEDYGGLVEAQNKALAALSAEMAEAIRDLVAAGRLN